jgi:hypothetical protein
MRWQEIQGMDSSRENRVWHVESAQGLLGCGCCAIWGCLVHMTATESLVHSTGEKPLDFDLYTKVAVLVIKETC